MTGLEGDRETQSATSNAALAYMIENPDQLLEGAALWLEDHLAKRGRGKAELVEWATRFKMAYLAGDEMLPSRSGGPVKREDRGSGWPTLSLALAALIDVGEEGVTANETKRRTQVFSDGISGSLAALHQAGVAQRLVERR